jgi:hypothetical protein
MIACTTTRPVTPMNLITAVPPALELAGRPAGR